MLGCLFTLTSLVGVPFYIMTALKWEKIFNIGGILGYLLFECVGFVVPFSFCILGRQSVFRFMSRLPKTVISVGIVCGVGLVLSCVPYWVLAGQTRAWRLLGETTSCAISAGVLLGGWQAYHAVFGHRR
jgi:hypothetical protein